MGPSEGRQHVSTRGWKTDTKNSFNSSWYDRAATLGHVWGVTHTSRSQREWEFE